MRACPLHIRRVVRCVLLGRGITLTRGDQYRKKWPLVFRSKHVPDHIGDRGHAPENDIGEKIKENRRISEWIKLSICEASCRHKAGLAGCASGQWK